MNYKNALALLLSFLFILSCGASASANHDRDSLMQFLPQRMTEEVFSIAVPTVDGKHPSQFQFAIADATEVQVSAWLKGEFFALQGLFTAPPVSNSKGDMFANVQEALNNAKSAINEVRRIGNFVSQFNGQSLVKLPVGLQKVMPDGTQFTAAIKKITLYPTHAELTIFAEVKTPDMERSLYFGAPDLKFTRRGGISIGSIGLLGAFEIPIMNEKGYLLFKGAEIEDNNFEEGVGTYAAFDCDGLRDFNLDLNLAFSRDVIRPAYENVPLDSMGIPDSTLMNGRVIAEIGFSATNGLNDILVDINIPSPFYHPEHPKVIWEVQDVIFDFSSTQHSEEVVFPIADHDPGLPEDMLGNWKGVFIRQFSVKLPDGLFSGGNGETTPQLIEAYDLVIDRSGFSGYVEITPVLNLDQGNADGWGYSIDWTKIHVYRNSLVGMEFRGLVDVPLLRNDESEEEPVADSLRTIRYHAAFDVLNQEYGFTIASNEERVYESGMLKATITLSPASQLSINYSNDDGFEIIAELHGSISVDAPLGANEDGTGRRLSIPEFTFQDFVIGNREPYIHHAGVWSLDEIAVDFGGFDLTISDVGLVSEVGVPRNVNMQFMGSMNLGANNTDISAVGGFRLQGEVEDGPDGKQNWKFKKVKMDALFVDYESPAVAFKGHIVFFENDAQFGGGFQGKMKLELKKLSEIGDVGIEAMALFGAVDGYRYFFVDVMAKFPPSMLTLAGIDIRGLGGGVYVNMRQQSIQQNFLGAQVGDILPEYPIDAPISNPSCACDVPPLPVCIDISTEDEEEYLTFLNMCEAICAGYSVADVVPCQIVPATEYELALRDHLGESLSGIQYVPDAGIKIGINFGVVLATTGDEEKFNANLVLNMEFNDGGSVNRVRLSGYANAMGPISWSGPSCEGVSMKFEMEYVGGSNTESGNGRFTAQAMVFVNTGRIEGANPPIPAVAAITDCSPLLYAGGVDMLFSKDNWYVWLGVPNNNPEDMNNRPPFPHYPIALELTGPGLIVSGYLNIGTQLPPFPGLPSNVAALSEFSNNLLLDEATRASGRGFAFGMRIQADGGFNIGIVSSDFHIDAGFDLMMQKYTNAYCTNTGSNLGVNGWYAAGQGWVYLDILVKVLGFEVLDAAIAAVIQVKGPNPTYVRGTIAGRYSVMGGLKTGKFNNSFHKGEECEVEGGGDLVLDYTIIGGIIPIDMAGGVFVQTQPNISFNYPVGKVVSIDEGNGPQNFVVIIDEFEIKLNGETPVDGELVLSENGYSADFFPAEMLAGESNYVIFATASLYPCTENGTPNGGPMDTDVKTISFTTGEGIEYIPLSNIKEAWPANGQFNYYQDESIDNYFQLASGQDYLLQNTETNLVVKLSNDEVEAEVSATYDTQVNKISFDLPPLTPGGAYKLELFPAIEGEILENQRLLEMYFRTSKYGTFEEKMNNVVIGDLQPGSTKTALVSNLQEPFGKEEIIGIDGLPQPMSIAADLNNTDWWDQFSNIPGLGNMYGSFGCSFDVTSLNYPIGNGANRQDLGRIPTKAVAIIQNSEQFFEITEDNYQEMNSSSNDNLLETNSITIEIEYYVHRIVMNDYRELTDLAQTLPIIEEINNLMFQSCLVNDGDTSGDDPSEVVIDNLLAYYNSTSCYKKFYKLREQDTDYCERDPDRPSVFPLVFPFVRKRLSPIGTETSIYPIVIKYNYPDGTSANFTHNLQFPNI